MENKEGSISRTEEKKKVERMKNKEEKKEGRKEGCRVRNERHQV